jgi:hypothetical protein
MCPHCPPGHVDASTDKPCSDVDKTLRTDMVTSTVKPRGCALEDMWLPRTVYLLNLAQILTVIIGYHRTAAHFITLFFLFT